LTEAASGGSNQTGAPLRKKLRGPRLRGVRAGVWILVTLAFVAASYPLFAALAQPGTSSSDEVVEDFNSGHVARPDRLISVDGFKAGDLGWYLDPGTNGRLVYRIPGSAGKTIALSLWIDVSSGVTDTVIGGATGQPDIVLSTNTAMSGNRLVLPSGLATAPSIDIKIQATNKSGALVLVVDQLVSYDIQGTDPRGAPVYSFLAFGGLVSLATLAILRRRRHSLPVAVAMGAVVALATYARIHALFSVHGPLDPDAVGYRFYGDSFQWWPLFDHGLLSGNFSEREPLFPMVVHAYFQVLGSSDFHLRVVSSTLSIAVVVLSVVAARRRLRFWPAALAVGLLVAVSEPLILESVRGLRLELEMVVVLLLYLALDRGAARRPLLDALLVGAIGAAMVLTRTYFFPVFVAAVAISFLARYRPLPRALGLVMVSLILMGGAAAAQRIGLYEHTHNAFSDTAGYTRWNANVEHFALHRPLPHPELFPTLAQYQQYGPYFGPSISTTQYLLIIHSPYEFARDSLAGAREIFDTIGGFLATSRLGPAARLAPRLDLAVRWLVLLGLMGMLLRAWRHPRLAVIPAIVLSWLAMTAFLFDHGLLERYRHTWQTFPLALIAGAWLVESVFLATRHWIRRSWSDPGLSHKVVSNLDLALFPVAALLDLSQQVLPARLLLPDIVVLAATVGLLAYRRPAVGTAAMLLAVSVTGGKTGAAVAAVALVAILARERPVFRSLIPLVTLVPLALAVVLASGRPSTPVLLFVATMTLVVAAVSVIAREPRVRKQFLWLLAAIGLFVGAAYVLEPAAGPAAELAPVGLIAALWLYLHGERWALPLGLLNLAIVLLVDPFFAWLGVVVAVAWLLMGSGRLRGMRPQMAAAGATVAVLALLAGGASLAATSPTPEVGWRTQLTSTDSFIAQHITVDRAGDSAIWIYGSRASAFSDYPVQLVVNGVTLTDDLNSYLPTGAMSWVSIPLATAPHEGDQLDVRIIPSGTPNANDRYIQVGGVYARVADLSSTFVDRAALSNIDLSSDPGTQTGTFLIVLGDGGLPLAPDGLPEPMVQGRWQLPMGEWMPGEFGAPAAARDQAGTWQIWGTTLKIAARIPRGLGMSALATALNRSDGGFGPGLSARNEYLQAAADWGLPGLAGLLVVLGGCAWFARRSGDRLAVALVLMVAVSMIGESVLLDPAGAAAMWIVIGLCLASSTGRSMSSGSEPRSTSQA
jgi:hypothetical protein